MIHFLVTAARDYTITVWQASRRSRGLRAQVRPLHYEELERPRELAPGTYVFTDLERLGPARLELARRLRDRLMESPERFRVLNDPRVVLRRYELLRALHEAGRNRFRAVRAEESLDGLRYPVFVRQERDHTGSLTGLLPDRPALEAELRRLRSRLRSGFDPRDLLVVEFADTSGGTGTHAKYSAFRVGDHVLARYRIAGEHWVVKADGRTRSEAELQAEVDYIEANPHSEWLRETFALAGIDFGRVDYGEVEGRLQVWEINTNPTIAARLRAGRSAFADRGPRSPLYERGRRHFHERFRQALEEIDHRPADTTPVAVSLPATLVRGARRERLGLALGRRYRSWLRKPAGHAARVAAVTLTVWTAGLAMDAVLGTMPGAAAAALRLAALAPLTAALGYCALRAALGTAGRAAAVVALALGVPLVEAAGLAAVTGSPGPSGAGVAALAAQAVLAGGLLALALRGRGARPGAGNTTVSARDWLRHLVVALKVGGAGAVAQVIVPAATWSAMLGPPALAWTLLRGPLLLLAAAPLLAANRPGRWTPAWALAVAMGLLGLLAGTASMPPGTGLSAAGSIAPGVLVATGVADLVLGAALGLSADPLVGRRWRAWRRR